MSTGFFWLHDEIKPVMVRATGDVLFPDIAPFQIYVGYTFATALRGKAFAWHKPKKEVLAACERLRDVEIMRDERFNNYTGAQFLTVLKECVEEFGGE